MIKDELDWLEDDEKKKTIAILQDKSKTAQEKYDLLYDKFKEEGLTRLPILLGIYTNEGFKTRKIDGTDTADDNSAERNHGRAIRKYLNLQSKNSGKEIAYEYVPGPFKYTISKNGKIAIYTAAGINKNGFIFLYLFKLKSKVKT